MWWLNKIRLDLGEGNISFFPSRSFFYSCHSARNINLSYLQTIKYIKWCVAYRQFATSSFTASSLPRLTALVGRRRHIRIQMPKLKTKVNGINIFSFGKYFLCGFMCLGLKLMFPTPGKISIQIFPFLYFLWGNNGIFAESPQILLLWKNIQNRI